MAQDECPQRKNLHRVRDEPVGIRRKLRTLNMCRYPASGWQRGKGMVFCILLVSGLFPFHTDANPRTRTAGDTHYS